MKGRVKTGANPITLGNMVPKLLSEALNVLRENAFMPRIVKGGALNVFFAGAQMVAEGSGPLALRRAMIEAIAETVALHTAAPKIGASQAMYEVVYPGYKRCPFGNPAGFGGFYYQFPRVDRVVTVSHVSVGARGQVLHVFELTPPSLLQPGDSAETSVHWNV